MPYWLPATRTILDHNGLHPFEAYFGIPDPAMRGRGGFARGEFGHMNHMMMGVGHGRGGMMNPMMIGIGRGGMMNPMTGMMNPMTGGIGHHTFAGFPGRGGHMAMMNPMMGMGMMGGGGGFGNPMMGMLGGRGEFGGFPGQPQNQGLPQNTIGGLGAGAGNVGPTLGGQQLGPGGM
jgi:hypothetical protein